MEQVKSLSCWLACSIAFLQSAVAENQDSARFHLKDPTSFIESKIAALAIHQRDFDPFGQPQDPNKKIVKKAPEKKETTKTEQQVLIAKEIAALAKRINVIGNKFLIGNRLYRVNDQITVRVKEKNFPLQIKKIHRSKIVFIDLSDNSSLDLDLNNGLALPTGSNEAPSLDGNNQSPIELDGDRSSRSRR